MKPKPTEVIEGKIQDLIPDNKNFNKGTEYGEGLIKKSFEKFGAGRGILIDKNGKVIAGNKSLQKFAEQGGENIKIVQTKGNELVVTQRMDIDLDTKQGREMALADNATAKANIEWDLPVMELVCAEWDIPLSDWGVETKQEAEEDNYEVPDEIKTDIKLGDIFTLEGGGLKHRIGCLDSTDKNSVEKLLDGNCPILMTTDPPYGTNYDAAWRNKAIRTDGKRTNGRAIGAVTNDDRVDWTDAYKLFKGNVIYVWHCDRSAKEVSQNIEDAGFVIVSQIIWVKNNIVISRGDYHYKHEPCWYAVRKGKKHNWQGSRKEHSVWDIDKPMKSETGHSTQKPIECMARPIRNNSKAGESVYDPFLGSGTTLVAGHQLGRNVYGMEISESYTQICLDRILKLAPELSVTLNGNPYQPKSI